MRSFALIAVGCGLLASVALVASPRPRPAVDAPAHVIRLSYDDLDLEKLIGIGAMTAEATDKIPDSIKRLQGKEVVLRGFMKPPRISTDLPQFVQVRDTGMCCFGPIARIYHATIVTLKDGTTTDYIERTPFDVVGTFRIDTLQTEDGDLVGLYFLDNARVVTK